MQPCSESGEKSSFPRRDLARCKFLKAEVLTELTSFAFIFLSLHDINSKVKESEILVQSFKYSTFSEEILVYKIPGKARKRWERTHLYF